MHEQQPAVNPVRLLAATSKPLLIDLPILWWRVQRPGNPARLPPPPLRSLWPQQRVSLPWLQRR